MNKLILVALVLLYSASSHTKEIKDEELEGKWIVTTINDKNTRSDNEIWEFGRNTVRISINGKAETPEPYTLLGNTVYIADIKVEVLEISDTTMKATESNSNYVLERIK
jgi:hypothetical protein